MYKVFCDGASRSNPGEAAIGVSIEVDGKEIHTISRAIGIASNNVAEYLALDSALEYCLKNDFMNLEIFLDSKLVVEQVNGNFKVKSNNLKPLRDKILEHIEKLEFVSINHIYRENNKRADELANLALDS
tara:strand:- start:690 stop:1079 length:390 start_codon:yes stop_codon:yes gene_type:complete